MAQRRMFSKEITTSDLFVDMPMSSQLLYFHLGMEADDEGFIGNAKMLSRAYGMNNDDLALLSAKGFIIQFPTGVSVIKDWNINNKIRSDRLKKTIYKDEKSLLNLDVTGSYKLVDNLTTIPLPNDNQMSAQDRLGKERLGKESIEYIVEQSSTHYEFPDWLDNKYVEQVKKGNPKNCEYRIPIAYLNQVTKSNYKFVDSNINLVKPRIKEGYSIDDFKTVIDKKTNEWSNTDMAKYLRPQTLFNATKFESYLNQPDAKDASYYTKSAGQRFSQAELDELAKPNPEYGF